ncbi:MAG: HAD family hydrolase [Chloroflexota bacterium]
MNIKLIAIDVDGTLLDDQHQLSVQNEQAIQKALAANIQVSLATGRMRHSCKWLIERLQLNSPGIFIQGLSVCDAQGKVLFGEFLKVSVLERFLPFATEHGLSFVAFTDTQILTLERDEKTDIILSYDEPAPIVVPSLLAPAIHKIIIFDDPARVQKIRPLLAKHMGDLASVLITQPEMVEIMPPNTSKGHSLKWLASEMNLPLENVMAIGNAENDLTMIQAAGIGVAVKNSPKLIKDIADIVVASNNISGVAEAVTLTLSTN